MARMDAEVHTLGTVDAGEPRQLLLREGHARCRCGGLTSRAAEMRKEPARARTLIRLIIVLEGEAEVHDCMWVFSL